MKRSHYYPEPGANTLATMHGMPEYHQPIPIPRDRQIEPGELRNDYIANEGLGFCVFNYIPADQLSDPDLRRLWKRCQQSMQAIVEYLETVPSTTRTSGNKRRRLKLIHKNKRNRSSSVNANSIGDSVDEVEI